MQSQWGNGEIIIDRDFSNFLKHTKQLFSKLFLVQITRIHIFYVINFTENYQHKIYTRPTLERRKTLGHIRSINPNMIEYI